MIFLGMGKKEAVGKIYLFDFNKPNDATKELNIVAEAKYKKLNPHGISYWNDTKTGIGAKSFIRNGFCLGFVLSRLHGLYFEYSNGVRFLEINKFCIILQGVISWRWIAQMALMRR